VEGRLFLDVVIAESPAVFELFTSEDESLLLRRNSFLVLNLRLDVGDGVVGLNVQGDGLSRKGLDKDLHGTTTETQNQVEGGLFLDVVVTESPAVLELFPSEDESLLLRRDSFFVLNLGLHVSDGIIRLNVQRNRLSGEGLDENLHGTTSQTKHQVESGLLLDIVI